MSGVADSPPHWAQTLKDGQGNPPCKTLWIWNVPDSIDDAEIRDTFADFGRVETVTRRASAKRRIDTFVTFRDIDSAMKVVSYCQAQEFTQFGQRVTIRFSRYREHSETQPFAREDSKVTTARSEWFQPPSAPKAMLTEAKQVPGSPNARRSMKVDVSPPSLRRSEPLKPEARFGREPYRLDEQDWRPRTDRLYSDRSVDRYVPERRTSERDDMDRYSPEPYRHPFSRYRSRSRSSSYSPDHRARRRRSPSPIPCRSETIRKSDYRKCQTGRDAAASPSSISGQATKRLDLNGHNAISTIARVVSPSTDRHAVSANHEATNPLSAQPHLDGPCPSIPLISLSEARTVEHIDAVKADSSSMGAISAVPVATTNEFQSSARSSPSSLHRLRAPIDDTSSTTSSSSKASQRKKLCAYCKESETALSGAFTICGSCSRRYHARCGDPNPTSTTLGEAFLCGTCRRKPKVANEKSDLMQAPSPEPGTLGGESQKQDQISGLPIFSHSEQVRTASIPVLRPSISIQPQSRNEPIQKRPDCDAPEPSAVDRPFKKQALASNQTHPKSTLPTEVQVTNTASHGSTATLTEVQRRAQYTAHLYKGVTCPSLKLRLKCLYQDRCMFAHHDTGIHAPRLGQRNRRFTCYFWKQSLPCDYSHPCPYAHQDTGLYVGRDQKASLKHITCGFWRINGICKLSDDECLFTHQDTGIYAAGISADRSTRTDLIANSSHQLLSTSSSSRSAALQSLAVTPVTSRQSKEPMSASFQARDSIPKNGESASASADSRLAEHVKAGETVAKSDVSLPSLPASIGSTIGQATLASTTERMVVCSNSIVQGGGTSSSPAASVRRANEDPSHGVDTHFSPTSSTHRNDNRLIHGEDMPFSPAPSIDSNEIATLTNVQQIMPTSCSITPTSAAKDTPLSNSNSSSAVPESQPNKISQKLSPHNLTSNYPDNATPPRKHFAKRTARDPRLLKLAQASKLAQISGSPDASETSNPILASIKKCEKCQKRIIGSASLCVGCSGVNESEKVDVAAEQSPFVGVSTTDEESGKSNLIMQMLSADIITSKADEADAGNEELAKAANLASSTSSTTEGIASLKRPSQDSPFIQRKRSRLEMALKSAHSPLGPHEGPAHVKSQFQKHQESLKNAPSLEELTRLARDAKGLMSGFESSWSRESSVRPQEKQVDEGSTRPPLIISTSETAVERTAKIQAANLPASEGESTKRQRRSLSPSLQTINIHEKPSRDVKTPTEVPEVSELETPDVQSDPIGTRTMLVVKKGKKRPTNCKSCARAHKKCFHVVRNQSQKWTRCESCARTHKKCLHTSTGVLDPGRCAAFLKDHKGNPDSSLSSVNGAPLAMIKATAARLDTSLEKDSEVDTQRDKDYVESSDHQRLQTPASPSSSENPLGANVNSSAPILRLRLHQVGERSTTSTAVTAADLSSSVNPSILTPAHTPSPMAAISTISTKNLNNTEQSSHKAEVMEKLRARGVQFESDDSDSDEEMEEARPAASRPPTILWPKQSSHNLFDVAPLLRPPLPSPVASSAPTPNLRAGMSKKQLWKNLTRIQTAERRSHFGNAHQIVSRDLPSQMVTTTIAQDLPITEEEKLRFVIPEVETKKVDMPFERFLKMPTEPVVVRVGEGRDKNGLWDVELAWKDGRKENMVTAGGRRLRGDGERWPFARG